MKCFLWAGTELNHRRTDFQSVALPTELPTRHCEILYQIIKKMQEKNRKKFFFQKFLV